MYDQPAPAAADVEQFFPGFQAQLCAQVIELAVLGLVDGVLLAVEESAGVDHVLVEPEAVKIVGDIVMILDRLSVTLLRMRPAAQFCGPVVGTLGCPRDAEQFQPEADLFAELPIAAEQIVAQLETAFQIAMDVEIVEDESLSQRDFGRAPEDLVKRRRVLELKGELRRVAAVPPFGAVPKTDGERLDFRPSENVLEELDTFLDCWILILARWLAGDICGHDTTSS